MSNTQVLVNHIAVGVSLGVYNPPRLFKQSVSDEEA